MTELEYSQYFGELKGEEKKRYEDKVKIIGCAKDPYCYLESKNDIAGTIEWTEWPEVMYPDVYNYLVHTVSLYTGEEMRAYKSLDGFNFLVNGWLNSIAVIATSSGRHKNYLFLSSVKHSQSLSLVPLKVWVATKESGEVLCGHSTCMAGLGEACSHIASVLFAAQTNTETKSQFSSTSLPCSWLPPTFRSVKFDEISNIDFATPQHKRKQSDSEQSGGASKKHRVEIPESTEEDIRNHYSRLSKVKGKPILLSFVSGLNDTFVPMYVSGVLPKPLTHLYDKAALSLSFPELLNKRDEAYNGISLTVQQASRVEEETRQQSKSKIWFEQRSGRVTASKLHSVLHTELSNPSISLIKSICYPQQKFFSEACVYGCKHEDDARSIYTEIMNANHGSFTLKASGLLLDPLNPFVGASPDGIIMCSCCDGCGVLEIKCPYSCRGKTLEERAEENSFFLEEDDHGNLHLKKNHPYYSQVLLQMKLYRASYCDFIVWRQDEVFIQRISFDVTFITEALSKIPPFIKLCILPELVGKWFTRPADPPVDEVTSEVEQELYDGPSTDTIAVTSDAHSSTQYNLDDPSADVSVTIIITNNAHSSAQYNLQVSDEEQESEEDATLWCYCRKDLPEEELVGCDNPECAIKWFHLSCLQLTTSELPKGKWFCPDCHKARSRQRKRKGKAKLNKQ